MTHNVDQAPVLPRLGLGFWQVPPEAAADLLIHAARTGYRLFDTAEAYYNETEVGDGLTRCGVPRDELIVQSKVWNDHHGFDATLRAFDQSLSRLGLEFLDVYLMHWPSQAQDRYVETWRAMQHLRDEGRVGRIGVCNFAIGQLDRLENETGELPFLNQVELHPYFQQRALRAFHAEKEIVTQSWSPLGVVWGREPGPMEEPVIRRIADKHERTPAQIILRWHLDEGLWLLTKTEHTARIEENMAAIDVTLDSDDLAELRALDRVRGRKGPDPETAEF